MKRIRIYTEDKNTFAICQLLNRTFSSYTIFSAMGVWRNISEKSICIEIMVYDASDEIGPKIAGICEEIKAINKQESVLYTIGDVQAVFV